MVTSAGSTDGQYAAVCEVVPQFYGCNAVDGWGSVRLFLIISVQQHAFILLYNESFQLSTPRKRGSPR